MEKRREWKLGIGGAGMIRVKMPLVCTVNTGKRGEQERI